MARLPTEQIRRELPATEAVTYLNNGTYGPLPRCAHQALAERAGADLADGRITRGRQGLLDWQAELAALRNDLGRLIGAGPTEIALTRSTTEGVNLGIWGRSWSAADEVVTTSQEHPGVLFPLAVLHSRYGVRVTFADIGHGEPDRVLESLAEAIRPGVRMVVLSHVIYTTGAVLPLRAISDLAHAVGAVVHVDGAQSVGAIPVDVKALGVDSYAFSGQKWLCGPDASGGLYVAPDQMHALAPTCVGMSTVDFWAFDPARPLDVTINPDAARYETGTVYRPAVRGFAAAVRWLRSDVGWPDAFADIEALAGYCRDRSAELPGGRVLTPPDPTSGLVSFQMDGIDVDDAVACLAQAGVFIRSIHENNALRISTGFYNTEADIDHALDLLDRYQRSR